MTKNLLRTLQFSLYLKFLRSHNLLTLVKACNSACIMEFCYWSQYYCAIVNSLELEVLIFGWNLELIVGLFSHNNGTGFYSKSYLWFNSICNLLGIGSFPSCAFSTHWENCRVPARCHAYGTISSSYSR